MKSKSKKIMEIIICIIIFIITLSILLVIINKTNINQNEFDNTNNIEEVNIIDDITYDDIDDTVLVEQDYSSKNALLIKNIKHDYSLYNSFDIDEYYTERDYCYIKVNYSKIERSFNNLQEVVYQRYIEEKGTWIKEKRDIENSLYLNPGNGIILDETNYYIPVYALHPGKNILMVTEKYKDNTKKIRTYVINRVESDFDKIYIEKDIKDSGVLEIQTYQDEMFIPVEDYSSVLLKGNFYSKVGIDNITWDRYIIKNGEWIKPTNTEKHRNSGRANIIGNNWLIDILDLYYREQKIHIIATDKDNNKIEKDIMIYNISKDEEPTYEITEKNGLKRYGSELSREYVTIQFYDEVKDFRCRKIIEEMGGTIYSKQANNKMYVVKLNRRFNTFEEVNEYEKEIRSKYKEVILLNQVTISIEKN